MSRRRAIAAAVTAVLLNGASAGLAAQPPDTAALYREHCAACHGPARLGGLGPALLPETMGRLTPEKAAQVIAAGRPATQMPAFGDRLDDTQVQALTDYVFRPPATPPRWDVADIDASRVVHNPPAAAAPAPVFEADPMNVFLVVESGDHHVTVLDGDRLEPIHRFASRPALHGGPKYSPEGRFVYFASRDGWVTRYDLWGLKNMVEVRAGINTRNLAVSADGRYVMVANYLPNTLVLMRAEDLSVIRVIEVVGLDGRPSRVSAVYTAPPRQSFIAALKDVKEVWEIQSRTSPSTTARSTTGRWRGRRRWSPSRCGASRWPTTWTTSSSIAATRTWSVRRAARTRARW